MDLTIVIIEDQVRFEEHGLVYALEDKYGKPYFFTNSEEGLEFIKSNLSLNIIVLLDIQFPEDQNDGHYVLGEIYNMSQLIPVILWSGISEKAETFSDFINHNAFGFLPKDATLMEALDMIGKAEVHLKTSLDNSLEDWIIQKPGDKDKPIYLTSSGTSLSMNDILQEIRLQTPVGKAFASKLTSLTIDLLLRGKEKLDD